MSIKITKLEYDPGDKRSYGSLQIEAETPKGKFRSNHLIDSSGELEWDDPFEENSDTFGIWLNDIKLDESIAYNFDPGLAHKYCGEKAVDRSYKNQEQYVLEAIEELLNETTTD